MTSHAPTPAVPTTTSPLSVALRRFRTRAGLTQEELAERAGLSSDAISALERGVRRRAQPHTLRALATALALSPAERSSFFALVQRGDHDPIRPGSHPGANWVLPTPLTAIIGREREVAAITRLLERPEVRLVTLIGPGGVGKTRLAIHVATVLQPRFEAAGFVDLTAERDAEILAVAIAHALGLHEQSGRDPFQHLVTVIGERRVLIVLDNFEHLVAGASIVAELMARCPNLMILATSRADLRIRGEHRFDVPPLGVPEATSGEASDITMSELLDYPAIRLFVERTQAVNPLFSLTSADATAVIAICRQLDGLPLAIELAAARTRILSPEALLAQLAHRLTLLTQGPVDAPARQQTLRDAIAWSYDLLSPGEQQLFRRLSVFVHGFTLDAAQHVGGQERAAAVLDALESLAGQSLVFRTGGAGSSEPRFSYLETVREFGLERLAASDEEATIREAHAAFYLALAERAEPELVGAAQQEWLERLETEHANLRAALAWFSDPQCNDLAAALRLAAACSWFWWYRRHFAEGRAILESLLARHDAESHGAAWAAALSGLGQLAQAQGDYARAAGLHETAVTAWRRLGDPGRLADALFLQGAAQMYAGAGRAIPILSESVAISRTLAHPRWLGGALWALGRALHHQGDREGAEMALTESLARARALDNPSGIAVSLWGLGDLAGDQGDDARALELLREALGRLWEQGEAWSAILCLERLASIRAHHEPQPAAHLLSAASAWRRAAGLPMPLEEQDRHEQTIKALHDRLGDVLFSRVWEIGEDLTPEEAVAEALEPSGFHGQRRDRALRNASAG